MSGRPSRSKGQRGEREVCHLVEQYLPVAASRVPRSGGGYEKGDLHLDPDIGLHVEVKRGERWTLPEWIEQASDDCPEDHTWILAFRKNRGRWYACMELERLLTYLSQSLGLETGSQKP